MVVVRVTWAISTLCTYKISPQQVVGIQVISTTRSVAGFVYDTYRQLEATRWRRGCVHMFVTHCPTVTLQLHNFDFFMTYRTSSLCTVAWQLARFLVTQRFARSLGDSWASCTLLQLQDVTDITWWVKPSFRPSFHESTKCCIVLRSMNGWQVSLTLCDHIWHVSSRSGVTCCYLL